MIRSTTPTIRLHIKNENFNMDDIDICHITIENDSGRNRKIFEEPVIDKDEKIISVTLSQVDTSDFETGKLLIQVKIKLAGDTVVASHIIETTLHDILEMEQL